MLHDHSHVCQELEERLGCVAEEKEELNSQLSSMKEHHVSLQQETRQMEQELEATKTELRTRYVGRVRWVPPMGCLVGSGVMAVCSRHLVTPSHTPIHSSLACTHCMCT